MAHFAPGRYPEIKNQLDMKKKVMLMWAAVAVVVIAVSAVQADTYNVVGGNITVNSGWDNDKPSDTSPGFIAVDGVINDGTFGFGMDTVITQTAGIIDAGSAGMNFGAFNNKDGGGTWNMSGGMIISRAITMNADIGSNSTMNISGGTLMLNGTGIELGKGSKITSLKVESYLNISGSAILDETLANRKNPEDLLHDTDGNYDIASNWTGYWTNGLMSGNDWKDFVVGNVTVDGAFIDAATFDSTFTVTDGGQRLAMVPEPATLSLLAIGGLHAEAGANVSVKRTGTSIGNDVSLPRTGRLGWRMMTTRMTRRKGTSKRRAIHTGR